MVVTEAGQYMFVHRVVPENTQEKHSTQQIVSCPLIHFSRALQIFEGY